jgi:hypothetical protein
LLVLAGIVAGAVVAAPMVPATRAEVEALLAKLESSGCEFNRNGAWYAAAEAKQHLQRKLDYLEQKGLVQSTEQFIEMAGSTSSVTGQPYLVRCGNGAVVRSATWLTSQMQALRAAGPAKRAP